MSPDASRRLPVTLCVNTYNAETTLETCLASCVGWVSEIVVGDMSSEDRTAEIARSFGARLVIIPRALYVEPGRQALIARARQPWVLVVDADETIPGALWYEVSNWLDRGDVAGVFIPRSNTILGRALRYTGYWPDYQLRLFRSGSVRWPTEVHAVPELSGRAGRMPPDPRCAIQHRSHSSIGEFVGAMNRYSDFEVGKWMPSITWRRKAMLIGGPLYELVYRYVFKQGFRDGRQGLQISLLMAGYRLMVALKVWENRTSHPGASAQAPLPGDWMDSEEPSRNPGD